MNIAFEPSDWNRIEQDYVGWWNHDLDRPLVQIEGQIVEPGTSLPSIPGFHSNYAPEVTADEIIRDVTAVLESKRFYGDAFPRWWLNFGPGILAGFLGARVHSVERTVWFEPPDTRTPGELSFPFRSDTYWWQRIVALTEAAVAAWGDQVQVSHTDLGGNLDVIASFRTTENLLLDLYDSPEEIGRLVSEVTAAWIDYYDRLDHIIRPRSRGTTPWAPIWSPDRTYMLQCDFAYMISPSMFERFVVPDIATCCQHLEHGFYHLDGPGQIPHIDLLLEIPRLRGIQWIPGDGNPPSERWIELLKRIIDGGMLCQLFVTAEGALEVVRNIGGKGFLLAVSDAMTQDEATAFLSELRQQDIGQN